MLEWILRVRSFLWIEGIDLNQLAYSTCPQVTGLYVVTDLFPFHMQARKVRMTVLIRTCVVLTTLLAELVDDGLHHFAVLVSVRIRILRCESYVRFHFS